MDKGRFLWLFQDLVDPYARHTATSLLATYFRQPSVQFSSVVQSCPTLCDPMDCSTPSFSVHHQFPELTQTHVHRVGDAIQLGW